MSVVGYARVSTEEQASEGVSLAAQEAKVRGYCALYEHELVRVVVDGGVSAKTLDRPGMREVLAMLEAGEVQGLVIANLDRMTRSVRDLNYLIDHPFGEGRPSALMSVSDSLDTRTASGILVINILGSVAQWQR